MNFEDFVRFMLELRSNHIIDNQQIGKFLHSAPELVDDQIDDVVYQSWDRAHTVSPLNWIYISNVVPPFTR